MPPDQQPLVVLRGVSKRFPGTRRRDLATQALPVASVRTESGTLALADIDLIVSAGEMVGVIGGNGAGKSTLLKLLAGVMGPTSGQVEVRGMAASMIELTLPFHRELTGRENLPLVAGLYGVEPDELDDVFDELVEFSGLEAVLDLPVKHYSSGMVARLGFAIATHVPASVLLIDEVLAVGDRAFQQRCVERVRSLAAGGTAVLFVSHGLDLVCQVCDRAIWLDGGRIVDDGPAVEVVGRYAQGSGPEVAPTLDGARIADVTLLDDAVPSGESLEVTCTVEVTDPRPYELRTHLATPSTGPTVVNVDRLPPGALDAAGTWTLRGSVGPLLSTACRLSLVTALVSGTEEAPETVDVHSVPFDMVGEQLGAVFMPIAGAWSVVDHRRDEDVPSPRAVVVAATALDDAAVSTRGLTKRFAPDRRSRRRHRSPAVALDDVSFDLSAGQAVGLIGPNGSGKSTLLRILAGVTDPTAGTWAARGRVAAVLELEAGLHGDLTGLENLDFLWRLHGGAAEEWGRARDRIAGFADLQTVLDDPVKHYSTGMRARLALALALELEPDILLVDEALSVGDQEFREQVRDRLRRQVDRGATLVFASHDLHLLSGICTRVLQLEAGRLVADGPTAEVIASVGGAGWAGGTTIADGGIALGALRVQPDVIGWNEPFTVEVPVEVVRPNSDAYLEFSVRETLAPSERARRRTPEQVLQSTIALQRIKDLGEALSTPGSRVIRGQIAGLPIVNTQDVVVSVVDGVEGQVVSEQWHTTFFGASGEVTVRFLLDWELVEHRPR